MSTAAIVGGLMGLSVQLYVNAVRKLPLLRNPWEHVVCIGLGAYGGCWLKDFEERTTKDVEAALAKREAVFVGKGDA